MTPICEFPQSEPTHRAFHIVLHTPSHLSISSQLPALLQPTHPYSHLHFPNTHTSSDIEVQSFFFLSFFNFLQTVGANWAATIIAIVTITALSVTTLCSLFGQPRIFFRMAHDGLLFKPFGTLTEKSQVPLWGTLFSGVSAGLIALALDIGTLSDMISMGTLMAFTTVCGGILVLRLENNRYPSLPGYLVIFFIIASAGLGLALRHISDVPIWALVLLIVVVLVPTVWLCFQGRAEATASYLCPLVPILPLFGIFCNVYLIVSNTALSYYRIIIWTAIGMLIYFFYGIRHSTLRSWNTFRLWPAPTYSPTAGHNGSTFTPTRHSPNLQGQESEKDPLLAGY